VHGDGLGGLEWAGREYSFAEIDARADRAAGVLAARGFTQGDRLCVQLANCIEMIDLHLACLKLGVIFVPVNVLYKDREIAHIVSDAEPKWFVTERDLPELRGQEAPRGPGGPPHIAENAPAAIVYTSGTTGASKGAILTRRNLAVNAATLLDAWRITSADRLLLALPLFHVHALGNGIHCWLASRCRMRLLERFEHQTAAQQLLDFKPTLFFGVPTIYVRLLETPAETAREIGRNMRLFVSGSAPLPAQVLEDFRERFGHTILERYGMTETLMITSNPYEGERKPGTVGPPLPGVEVKLDENGEIWVRGANVCSGYWKRPDAFKDGWFQTGDMATVDGDGYYTLCGRKSDLIISGGFNIYPREIEELLQEQPEIAEAAVVGEADRVRGEVPVAYVVTRAAIDPGELAERCRTQLASFKIPRRFEIVDRLPRNALGKVQKHLLRAPQEGLKPPS
jgi:malonyl-CoA/methylmalonyl-CoA synthetase